MGRSRREPPRFPWGGLLVTVGIWAAVLWLAWGIAVKLAYVFQP